MPRSRLPLARRLLSRSQGVEQIFAWLRNDKLFNGTSGRASMSGSACWNGRETFCCFFNRVAGSEVKYATPSFPKFPTPTPEHKRERSLPFNSFVAISNQWKSWCTTRILCFNKSFKRNYHFNRNSQLRSVMQKMIQLDFWSRIFLSRS